jgi:hypothetical protein
MQSAGINALHLNQRASGVDNNNDNDNNKWQASVVTRDYFTYTDQPQDFWSGYFSTRPYLKQLIRTTGNAIRAARMLFALARSALPGIGDSEWKSMFAQLQTAARQVALLQHHDGITGTCRAAVADDYTGKLLRSLSDADDIVEKLGLRLIMSHANSATAVPASSLSTVGQRSKQQSKDHAMLQLISLPKDTANSVPLVLFNPSTSARSEVVRVLVDSCRVRVVDSATDKAVESQLLPNIIMAPGGSLEAAQDTAILLFVANVPPLGFSTYYIAHADSDATDHARISMLFTKSITQPLSFCGTTSEALSSSTHTFENDHQRLVLNLDSGLPASVTLLGGNAKQPDASTVRLDQSYVWYNSHGGSYLFTPNGASAPVSLVCPPSNSMNNTAP